MPSLNPQEDFFYPTLKLTIYAWLKKLTVYGQEGHNQAADKPTALLGRDTEHKWPQHN